jgi:thiol:disulfide interchange protein
VSTATVLLVVGGLMAAAGFAFGRVFAANFELDARGKVRKGVGVAAAVLGLVFVLRGLGWIGAPVPDAEHAELEWRSDFAAAEAEAKAAGKPMLVDFTADWCKACKQLEAETFSAKDVATRLGGWVTVQLDLTDERPDLDHLQKRFKVSGLPTVAMVDARGEWLEPLTLTGFEPAEAFLARMDKAEAGQVGTADTSLAGRIGAALDSRSLWVYALVFLAGIVASLSPCVYPLIPITISLFGARDAESRFGAFFLSLVYVSGIAATYSALGLAAATSGKLFGSALQSPWVVGGIATIFIAMGLSMVGVFEIRLPAGLNERLGGVSNRPGGRFLSAFLMGSVAGVVAAPCVGPPLVAVLTFVATQGDVSGGLLLLLTYSLGMGLLFIILGTFTQLLVRMPKSGTWMEVVKGSMGMVMLVVGLVYVQDVVPFLP